MINTYTEPRFIVDADSRQIIVPSYMENIGVELDNKSETIVFEIPRYFDNIDLSEKTCVVEYINANDGYGEVTVPTELEDDDTLLVSWLLTDSVTRYAGQIQFSVSFRDATSKYLWSTTPATANVLKGLAGGNSILAIDVSTASELINQINTIEGGLNGLSESISTLEDAIAAIVDPNGSFAEKLAYLTEELVSGEDSETEEYRYYVETSGGVRRILTSTSAHVLHEDGTVEDYLYNLANQINTANEIVETMYDTVKYLPYLSEWELAQSRYNAEQAYQSISVYMTSFDNFMVYFENDQEFGQLVYTEATNYANGEYYNDKDSLDAFVDDVDEALAIIMDSETVNTDEPSPINPDPEPIVIPVPEDEN